jgi:hypothetical protein
MAAEEEPATCECGKSEGGCCGGHDCEHHEEEEGPPADLSHAGAVVDKAIEYMSSQNIGALAIASALLGGAIGMLAQGLDDDAIVRVLENAIASVRAGELHRFEATDAG